MKRQVASRRFEIGVWRVIGEHDLIAPGATVLAAVSGGADSMCLLECLHSLSQRRDARWELHAAHLHHGIRGRAADADQRSVARACERLGVPLHTDKVDVPAFAHARHQSLELAARNCRHAFLGRTAAAIGAACVALAHQADDQAETVLHNLLRGTGLRGLAGMPIRRPLANASDPLLIRPLLTHTRAQVENYLAERRVTFRTDSTNRDSRHTRNRLRRRVLPMLRREVNPAVDTCLLRLAQLAGAAADSIESQARELIGRSMTLASDGCVAAIDRVLLMAVAPIVRGEVLRQMLQALGAPLGEVGHERLTAALRTIDQPHGGRRVQLPAGAWIERRRNKVLVGRNATR